MARACRWIAVPMFDAHAELNVTSVAYELAGGMIFLPGGCGHYVAFLVHGDRVLLYNDCSSPTVSLFPDLDSLRATLPPLSNVDNLFYVRRDDATTASHCGLRYPLHAGIIMDDGVVADAPMDTNAGECGDALFTSLPFDDSAEVGEYYSNGSDSDAAADEAPTAVAAAAGASKHTQTPEQQHKRTLRRRSAIQPARRYSPSPF
jgi:hypothetical protein